MIDVGRLKDIINAGCDDCAMDDEWRADAIAWVEAAAAPVEPAPGGVTYKIKSGAESTVTEPQFHRITDALADEPDPFDVIETLQARIARLEGRMQEIVDHPAANDWAKNIARDALASDGEDKG